MSAQAKKPDDSTREPHTENPSIPHSDTPDRLTIRRPARAQLSPEETRARMEAFAKEREEAFVAAIREDED